MQVTARFAIYALVFLGLGILGCAGGAPNVDLGDGSSTYLTWRTGHHYWEKKDLDKALAYSDKALELYGDEARRLQASLSDFPSTDPQSRKVQYKALNDMGLVALLRGEILMDRGDRAGAKQAFSMVIEDFGYAQFQDLGEWEGYAPDVARDGQGYFKLAEAAQARLTDLEAGRD